jgi:penicillin-binding protein 1A
MRYAVRDRPVEEFTTDLKLPEWQLEPDDEYYYGDPGDYYYVDEQGNLITPNTPDGSAGRPDRGSGFDIEGERPGANKPLPPPPPAANDDFLEEATGGSLP